MNAANHALVIAPGGAGLAVEKDLSRSPPSLMNPLIPASLQLDRRQKVEHDGARGRRDGGHIANKKGGSKAAL